MCNKSTNKDKNKTSNGLMKQTKPQLIDIILRKDEVERSLRAEYNCYKEETNDKIDDISKKLEIVQAEYNLLRQEYNELENDYHEECDENATIKQEYYDKITKYRIVILASISSIIGLILAMIM